MPFNFSELTPDHEYFQGYNRRGRNFRKRYVKENGGDFTHNNGVWEWMGETPTFVPEPEPVQEVAPEPEPVIATAVTTETEGEVEEDEDI